MWHCRILIKLQFTHKFSKKKLPILNFMKMRPAGVELFHTGGRAEITKQIIAFRNSSESAKQQKTIRERRERRGQEKNNNKRKNGERK